MGNFLLAKNRVGVAGLSAIAMLASGIGAALTPSASATTTAEEPVQVLSLTNSTGAPTEVATAGVEDVESALSVSGNSITPQLSSRLTQLLLTAETTVDPSEDNTALLTEPLAVDDFMVAGVTWNGGEHLAAGTEIYMRVREGQSWSEWYIIEEEDPASDGEVAATGTEPFISGGADAVQIWVSGDVDALPGGMEVSLIPANTDGDEETLENPESLVAEPTEIAPEDEELDSSDDTTDETVQLPTTTQTEDTATAQATDATETETVDEGEESGTTAGGEGINPSIIFPTTTTKNDLPVAVTTRSEWGANESYRTWSTKYVSTDQVIVHHTAGTNNYTATGSASIVRGIYYYHAVTLGWGDIGYNFLVDKYGQVFEGRYGTTSAPEGKMVVGGHALGANTGSMGISMMGTYTSTSPTTTQLTKVGKLAGWLLARAGVTDATTTHTFTVQGNTGKYSAGTSLTRYYIAGHRDFGYTTCPGDAAYALLWKIRNIAQATVEDMGGTDPVGEFETLTGEDGALQITGWADDADTYAPAYIRFRIDGGSAHKVEAREWRSDIKSSRSDVTRNRTGFSAEFTASAGTHKVCISIYNTGDGSDTYLGCQTVTVTGTTVYLRGKTTTALKLGLGESGVGIHVGDWDGNGSDSLASQDGRYCTYRNANRNMFTSQLTTFIVGRSTDTPIAGDWDGDGSDSLLVRRGDTYYMKDTMAVTPTSMVFTFGEEDSEILVGDWDGDGVDTLAIREGTKIYISNTLGSENWDTVVTQGRATDTVIVGDWDGDGKDTFGFRRDSLFILKNSLGSGGTSTKITYGRTTDIPIAGDWNADGIDTIGVVRSS